MGRLIYVWYCNFEGNRRHCYGAALSQEYLVTTDIVKMRILYRFVLK